MCYGAIIQAVVGVASADKANAADADAAEFEAAVAEQNATISDQTAVAVRQKGHSDEEQYLKKVAALQGTQRATFGANNVEASSGSALEIQAQTAGFGAADASRIRSNALREAWGYDVEAQSYRNDANYSRVTSKVRQHTRMLTAYGNAASTLGNSFGNGEFSGGGDSGGGGDGGYNAGDEDDGGY